MKIFTSSWGLFLIRLALFFGIMIVVSLLGNAQYFNYSYDVGTGYRSFLATELPTGYRFTSVDDLYGINKPISFLDIQTDQNGNQVSSNSIEIPSAVDEKVFPAANDQYFIIGKNANLELTLRKLSSAGTLLWSKKYVLPDVADLFPQLVSEALNGDILIAGARDLLSENSQAQDLFVLRTQANGNQIQSKTYPVESNNGLGYGLDFEKLIGAKDNGALLLYRSVSPTGKLLLKIDVNGQPRYHKFLTCCINEIPDLEDDVLGNVLFCERQTSFSGPPHTISILRKLNADGQELCSQNLDEQLFDPNPPAGIFSSFVSANQILATPDGGYLVTGTVSSILLSTNFFLVKIDANCEVEWVNKTHEFLAEAHSIQLTSDNAYLFTGNLDGKSWLMKTDTYGNLTPPNGHIDLELNIVSNSNSFSAFEPHSITVQVRNNSQQVATGVRISVPEPDGSVLIGGNEYTASQGTYDPYVSFEWQTGALIPGATAFLELHIYTLQEANPILSYAQVVAANETDVDSSPANGTPPTINEDDEANLFLYPPANQSADLELQLLKSQPGPFYDGGNMRIFIENKGAATATNVAVRLDNNAYSTWVISSNPSQGTSDLNNFSFQGQATWEVGTLVAGASASLDIVFQRIDQYNTAYFFAQVLRSDQVDPDSQAGNDLGNPFTPDEDDEGQLIMEGAGGPPADLELFMNANQNTAAVGDQVTYRLLVENNGSYPSRPIVSVKDILPAGLTFLSANASTGSFDAVTGIWTIGSMAEIIYPDAPSELIRSATLDLLVRVDNIPAAITNFAQIQTGYDIDATPGNDTDNTPNEDDEAAVSVLPEIHGNTIDLELSLNGPVDFQIYETLKLRATLNNTGSTTATGVRIHLPKPSGLVYSGGNEYTASQGTFNPHSNQEWSVGTIPPGGAANLEINYYTLQDAQAFINYAQVIAADQADIDSSPANGTCCTAQEDDEAVWTIIPETGLFPDLVLSNLQAPASGMAGTITTFSFDLSNLGNTVASGDYQIGDYLSTDPFFSPDDIRVGEVNTGNTPIGTIAAVPASISIPAGFAPGDYYLILIADIQYQITESNESNNGLVAPFKVLDNTAGTYCNSYGVFPWHEWISEVAFGIFVHPSGKDAYADFTGTSTSVEQDTPYPLSLVTGFSYYTEAEFWRVWIDYNQDGDFEDGGELAFERLAAAPVDGTPTNGITGTIYIPATAAVGATRMRVSMKRGSFPAPCEVLPFGEVEDYTVIIEPKTIAPKIAAEQATDIQMNVYPNPAEDRLFLDLSTYAGASADLFLYDHLGRLQDRKHLERISTVAEELDLKNYRNGLYYLTLKVKDQRLITKHFIIHQLY